MSVVKRKTASKTKMALGVAADTPYALSEVSKRMSVLEKLIGAPVVIDMKDVKTPIPKNIRTKLGANFRGATRNNPFRTKVSDHFNIGPGAANTAQNAVSNLTPLNLTDSKTFASVFDEARVVGVTVEVFAEGWDTVGGTVANVLAVTHLGMAYDPANAGVYTGLATLSDASHRVGPLLIPGAFSFTPNLSKRQRMTIKIPATVDPGLVTDLLGSNWVGAADTGVLVGYLKPYIEAAGAGRSVVLSVFLWYDIEYCFRT